MNELSRTIPSSLARMLAATLAAIVFLSGCASTPSVPIQDVSQPALNVSTSAYLGERLLMQAQGFYAPVVRINSLRGAFVRVNDEMFCQRERGAQSFYSFNGGAVTYLNFLGGRRANSNRVEFKADRGEVCFSDLWSGCFSAAEADFSFEASGLCSQPNAMQRVIEYNGKSGDTLNFTYREFRGRRMDSQFTQNFTMDLNEGSVINYRGARIEVLTATNQQIDYRVLQNFASL